MTRGVFRSSEAGSQGSGSLRRAYRPRAAVRAASGMAAPSELAISMIVTGNNILLELLIPSKLVPFGRKKVVCFHATAYSAYEPPGVSISWKAATRSPFLNSTTFSPTSWTMPEMSSPVLVLLKSFNHSEASVSPMACDSGGVLEQAYQESSSP